MKKIISILAIATLFTTAIASCTKAKAIKPQQEVGPVVNPTLAPDSIEVTYIIHVLSTDTTKVTNLVNGIGYAYKDAGGNWQRVTKVFADVSFIPVHAGQIFRGTFYVPAGLDNPLFQSSAFLLSSNSGDVARNPANLVTIKVFEDGNLIVDKSASGIDSVDWGYDKWNINSTKPLHR